MKHYETKEELKFNSAKELIEFLSYQNPLYMKYYREEYNKENPDYEIRGFGKEVEIRKISKKDKWFNKTLSNNI